QRGALPDRPPPLTPTLLVPPHFRCRLCLPRSAHASLGVRRQPPEHVAVLTDRRRWRGCDRFFARGHGPKIGRAGPMCAGRDNPPPTRSDRVRPLTRSP